MGAVVVCGPSFDAFLDNVYDAKDIARKAATLKGLIDFVATNKQKIEVYPPVRNILAVEYGLVLCKQNNVYVPRLVVFEYCADQNAANCTYGSWYTAVDIQGECRLVAYVATLSDGSRVVAVYNEATGKYDVYDAPVFVKLKLENGAEFAVALGDVGAIVAAVIIASVMIGGGIIAYSIAKKSEADAQAKWADTVRYIVEEACRDDPRCAIHALSSAAIVQNENTTPNIFGLLQTIGVGLAGLTGIILLMIRLQVLRIILDMFKGLFKRGGGRGG